MGQIKQTLLLSRFPRRRLWSLYHYRTLLVLYVQIHAHFLFMDILRRGSLFNCYARMLGASVGRDADVATMYFTDHDLVSSMAAGWGTACIAKPIPLARTVAWDVDMANVSVLRARICWVFCRPYKSFCLSYPYEVFCLSYPYVVLCSNRVPSVICDLMYILFFAELQVSIGDRAVVEEDCIPHPQVKALLDGGGRERGSS